jgi:very-short-patch-repair endonuclease
MHPTEVIIHIVDAAGGAARREHLLSHGVTRRALQRACEQGAIVQPARGIYALPGCDRDVRLAADHGALLTCLSGARRAGLWVRPAVAPVHLACHRHTLAPVPTHRLNGFAGPAAHPWAAPTMAIVVHALRCLPELDALIVAESAVVLGHVQLDDLFAYFDGRRDAPIRAILALIDPKSQSIVETILRYACQRERLGVETQVWVPGLGHVDLRIEGWLYTEVHGEKYHNDAQQWAEDLRRANVAALQGLPLLQFTGRQVLNERDFVMHVIHQAIGQRHRWRTTL